MVYKYICNNGIRIMHEKVPSARSLAIGIWVQAGSNDEREEEAGLAHFIEHMLFKGTKKYSAKYIAQQFDQLGGELNAFTSKEATCFHTTVLKDDAKQAMELLADMLFNSTFHEDEIAKEKQVVLEEIAMYEDTPDDEVHEQLWQTMYPNDPLGKRVLGNRTSVMRFTKQAIRKFMKRLYQPNKIVISIAGSYEDDLISFIEALFSSLENNREDEMDDQLALPQFQAQQITIQKDVEQAHLCIGFPTFTMRDERKHELAIVDYLVGESMSSRLFQEVREKRGLAYSVYSFYALYDHTGVFLIYGGTSPEKLEQLQESIHTVLREIVDNGVSSEEILHAQQSIKNSFLLGLESVESRMSRNGHQELFLQDHPRPEAVIQKINDVHKKDVEKLIKELFTAPYAQAVIRPELK